MKRLVIGSALGGDAAFNRWVQEAFRQIEQASAEDIQAVLSEFSITGVVTPVRTLNASSATATDIRNFLATLIADIQREGSKRTYAS